ncbi:hypothetical protein WME98_15580 [Sorangium sp. So ce296]|uniref:hypothetical protein n=1 Tax=Sorangium sp. So ce296 TaxID=3133296 RepID=UPI003F5E937C
MQASAGPPGRQRAIAAQGKAAVSGPSDLKNYMAELRVRSAGASPVHAPAVTFDGKRVAVHAATGISR